MKKPPRGLILHRGRDRIGKGFDMPQSNTDCSFDGCANKAHSKSLCHSHYDQLRKGQELRPLRRMIRNATPAERFWASVDKSGECWLWTRSKRNGYGQFAVSAKDVRYAHRYAWEQMNGAIPAGMMLDHTCGTRSCCNPAHLRVVTNAQNSQNLTVLRADNTSGFNGVGYSEHAGKWRARVYHKGKQHWGGYHDTPEAAAEAAKQIRNRLFSHNDRDRVA